jgi:hypothetical protein
MMSLLDAFKSADDPCYAIEDESYDMASRQSGSVGPKVLSFLNEPLYRISNSVTLVHWATWPLCASENAPDVFEPFYLLERGGWSPGWDDGVFLFDRRREIRSRA